MMSLTKSPLFALGSRIYMSASEFRFSVLSAEESSLNVDSKRTRTDFLKTFLKFSPIKRQSVGENTVLKVVVITVSKTVSWKNRDLFSVRSKHSSLHVEEGQQKEKDSDEDLGLVLMMYMSGPTS